ncbi:MAG: hypothetical protein OEZ01_17630, partial [Candidatus Heimdallarchaeota archaeon]|nr:hypothetical protein [Candidatus Heimdallarchaeota archaeon]
MTENYGNFMYSGLSICLYMIMYEIVIHNIFVLNFGGGGLNSSVVLFLLTMTGFFYIGLHKFLRIHDKLVLNSILCFFVFIILLLSHPLIRLSMAVLAMILLTPIIIHALILQSRRYVISIIMGISFKEFIVVVMNNVSIQASTFTMLVFGVICIIWLSFGLKYPLSLLDEKASYPSISAVYLFIHLETFFLSSPSVQSTWFVRNYVFVILMMGVGLLLAYFIIETRMIEKLLRFSPILLFSFLLFSFLLIYYDLSYVRYIIISLTQLNAVLLLYIGIRENGSGSISRIGLKLGGIQFICIISSFLLVAAPFWTAMPGPVSTLVMYNDRLLMLLVG